jgi:hypothetical protein
MFMPLDGPSSQDLITISDSSQTEIKVGASVLSERKVVTIQPFGGDIRVFFVSGLDLDHGLLIKNKEKATFEASDSQDLYMISVSGTIDVVVIERA